MKRVLVTMQEGGTRRSFFPAEVKAFLEEHFEVVWNETGKKMTKEDLKPLLPEFDAVMTGWGSEFYDPLISFCHYKSFGLHTPSFSSIISHSGLIHVQ